MAVEPETVFRVATGLLIFGATATGLPQRLRADRIGGRVSPRVDPKWFWPLMAITLLPLALTGLGFAVEPRWVDSAQIHLPWGLRLAGVPAGAAALALFRWMFRHLGLNVTSTSMPRSNATLVQTGPYRWIRHPMYTATLIMIVAMALLTANLVVAIGGAGIFTLMAARSRTEERRLVEKFGEAYRDYQSRTGRFLPRMNSRS